MKSQGMTMPQRMDPVVATGLVTAPWWAGYLNQINTVLTLITLLVGLLIGWIRLRRAVRDGSGPFRVRLWRAIVGSDRASGESAP